MPCFSCKCFREGKGRNGERLSGGRGYCELWDQEYWRGHECNDFAPTWYGPKTSGSSLKEPSVGGLFGLFKSKKKEPGFFSSFSEDTSDDEYEEYDDSDALFEDEDVEYIIEETITRPSKRLLTVQKNITLDNTVFKKYGLSFKCNLVEDCDTLQLNFELQNTKGIVSKMSRDDELTIKANAYDAKGNLLCIEEVWIEYSQLKSGYVEYYFYFSSDSMVKAHSLRVYAIDPSDSDDESDNDTRNFLLNETMVSRFNEILNDSLKLLESTVYPQTYFGRYQTALDNAKRIAETTQVAGHKAYALEVIKDLTDNRSIKIKSFVDRCNERGRLYSVKDDLLSGKYNLPYEIQVYVEGLLDKIEEATDVPESGEYIYCSLSFDYSNRTYYYKTTDETIKSGDEVIVLVGSQEKKTIAKVVRVERFAAGKTPYPPSQTKDILGKCPY